MAAIIFGFITVMFLRSPQVITGGRIWAEEGHFLAASYGRDLLDALVWRTNVGYYQLHLTIGGLLSSRLPLTFAPIVTVTLSVFIWLTPLCIAMLDPVWSKPRRVAIIAVVFLIAPSGSELWLNLASLQFLLAATCALMLITEAESSRGRGIRAFTVLFSGLCGVAAPMLTPLFLAKAFVDRRRFRTTEAGILLATAALQLLLLIASSDRPRQHPDSLATIGGVILVRQILACTLFPIDTVLPADRIKMAVTLARSTLESGIVPLKVLCMSAPFILYGGFALAAWARKNSALAWLIGASMILVFGSLSATINPTIELFYPTYAHRYFYGSNVLVMLAAWVLVLDVHRKRLRRQLSGVLVVIMVAQAIELTRDEPYIFSKADWYAQAGAWQSDPRRLIWHAPIPWWIQLIPPDGGPARFGMDHPPVDVPNPHPKQ